MKKFLMGLMACFLMACASTGSLSPNAAIMAATQSVEILVDQAAGAVMRGRMSMEQGMKVVDKARKAVEKIEQAELALATCAPDLKKCDSVQKILDQIQPILLEMERELRKKE